VTGLTPLFAGIRVLELGQYVSVPYCAELFAHGGADVVKVEPVTGDETRANSEIIPGEGRRYIIKARGKRGIPIDLRSEGGARVAQRLALRSDIVLSNMRPGLVEELGLDYESLSRLKPSIIFGEIGAFGRSGPDAGKPSIDIVAQAYSGLMVSGRALEEGRPVPSEAFLADYMSAALLAFGITAALRHRDLTGFGQKVTTSLLQAALALQHATANVFDAVDGWKRDFVAEREARTTTFLDAYSRRQSARAANNWWYTTYETSDGFVVVGAPGPNRRRLAAVLGIDDPSFHAGWEMPDDPRPHMAALTQRAREAASRWRSADLVRALEAAGIPCSPVQFVEEVMVGEQARANGYVYSADHPAVGPMTVPAAPVNFSAARYEAASSSPAYGEHSLELLRECGFSAEEIQGLLAAGAVGGPRGKPHG
jgi:CoA:oxalate CoA-transferase